MIRAIVILLLLAVELVAQTSVSSSVKSVKGVFIAGADDHAIIYVNGKEAHKTDYGVKQSAEMELKVGDRITVNLKNDRDEKGFLMVFVSSDRSMLVNFRRTDYKVVPELEATDFTPEDFKRWAKFPKPSPKPRMDFPFKVFSDWVWGDTSKCIVAAIVTQQMITAKPER